MTRAIALGAFDGLHTAHTAVLEAAARQEGHAPPRLLADEDRNAAKRSASIFFANMNVILPIILFYY